MVSREEKEYYINLWRESFCTNKLGCGTPMFAVIVVGILIFLSSCATKTHVEYVDREVVRYESKIQIDTLINNVHDSIFVERNGDTVFVNKWHTVIKEKIKERIDTCWRDSIRTQTTEKVVEKQIIPKWCYGSLAICLLFIIFAIIKFGRKLW
jgi:hypothetical protein